MVMSTALLPSPVFSRPRLTLVFILAASVALSLLLVLGRVALSGKYFFVFMIWNLLLAIIPFAISTLLSTARGAVPARILLPAGVVWLLFFPNAPYILTDFYHLDARPGVPLWYDLILIASCAWNGLMLAYASLSDMQRLVQQRLGFAAGWGFATVALLLSGFGIYLGRYLRFNSWNILTNPLTLFFDIMNRILHPFTFPGTWGVTLVFGLFLLLGYGTVRVLGRAQMEG